MSTVNYHTSRSSNLAALNAIVLNVSTLTGSTIQTTATATTSSIVFSSMSGSTLTTSTMTGNQITISTLTVSSINNGTPGVAAYSTFNASSINATSTITTSTLTTTSNVGIGTAISSYIVDIYGSNPTLRIRTSTGAYLSGSTTILFDSITAQYPLAQIRAIDMGVSPNVYRGDLVFYYQYNTTLTEGLRLTNTGNLGVGTVSPAASLDVNGSIISRGQTPAIAFLGDIDGAKWTAKLGGYNLSFGSDSGSFTGFESGALYGRTYQYGVQMNSTGGMYIKGNVGIGTNSPNISLDAWGTDNGIGRNRNFGGQHDADKRDSFSIGRWDGGGAASEFTGMRCNVNTFTNAGFGPAYNNQAWISFFAWGNSNFGTAECLRIRGDGQIMFNRYTNGTLVTSSSNGLISVSSDRRIKEDIVYVEDTVAALDQINHLKPATFRFIGQPDIYLGFIAQDVEQYIPLAVDGKKHEYHWKTDDKGKPIVDGNGDLIYQLNDQGEKIIRHRGLTDRAIIAVQTLAIQELSKTATSSTTQIQELSKKNTALEEQLATILARLNAAGIA